jgi:RNA polymerase sigma factor (sigma-70 family)
MSASSPAERTRAQFFSLMGRHLEDVYPVVRHLLSHAEAVGDLLPGELTPEDVVDAVILRAYREFVKAPPEQSIRRWLVGIAREHVEAEIKRLRAWHARTLRRMEENVPDTPPTEWVSTLGDETLDFHEPDEDLKLEDVLPDLEVPTPEEVAETRELRGCVRAALATMPREWRQTLLRRHVDGLSGAELAKALGRSELETRRVLEHARQYLRQRLLESGCALKPDGLPTA